MARMGIGNGRWISSNQNPVPSRQFPPTTSIPSFPSVHIRRIRYRYRLRYRWRKEFNAKARRGEGAKRKNGNGDEDGDGDEGVIQYPVSRTQFPVASSRYPVPSSQLLVPSPQFPAASFRPRLRFLRFLLFIFVGFDTDTDCDTDCERWGLSALVGRRVPSTPGW